MERTFDVVIIGGGILGTSLSYFISALHAAKSVAVIEQSPHVAFHTSGRNTGKIHAPYLYNPQKKRLFAKAAFYGYDMWREYTSVKNLPFKHDGVIEVAVEDKDVHTLEKYMKWGMENGLEEDNLEIRLVSGTELSQMEPNVRCTCALVVSKEGSVNYGELTRSLMGDSHQYGTVFLLNRRAVNVSRVDGQWQILVDAPVSGDALGVGRRHRRASDNADLIRCNLLINAAGGESVDIAHGLGMCPDLTDVHFRGEYWKAPNEYEAMTKTSIYSVPEFPDYPFLDPHWIVRVDGKCEIGPNAVPVFSPYGYDYSENIREFLPKTMEMLGSGAVKAMFDRQFQNLVIGEMHSSLSKSAMINRVKRFLPNVNADHFKTKGTAGIRSSVIDNDGKFIPDAIIMADDSDHSFHILNYNSPGATGVLPFSTHVVDILARKGFLHIPNRDAQCGIWKFSDISDRLHDG